MADLARLLLDHTDPLGAAVLVGDDNPLTVAGGINAAVGSLYVSRTTGGVFRKRNTSATDWASATDRFHIRDFGAVCNSAANDTAAIQATIDAARKVGGTVVISGRPRVEGPLNLTFANGADATTRRPIRIVFEEGLAVGPAVDPASSCLIVDHNGVVFDCTGSYDLVWENPNIATVAGRTPSCGWLLARNVGGGNGGQHTFHNPRAWGSFVNGVFYSYASEVNTYHSPRCYNLYAGGEVWCVTAANIRGLASTFTTIATGVKSNINLNVHDGAAKAQNTGGRVFYLDRSDLVVVDGLWMQSEGGAAGHSLVYVDLTNGPSNFCRFTDFTGENGTNNPQYGFYFSLGAMTPSGWTIRGGRVAVSTNLLFAASNVVLDGFHIEQLVNPFGVNAIVCANMQNSFFHAHGGSLTISGTSTKNTLIGDVPGFTIGARVNDIWIDYNTGTLAPAVGVKFQATQAASSDPNTLDDYEEADFTPALAFSTSGSVTYNAGLTKGTYTKKGREVTVTAAIQLAGLTAPTGNVTVTGMPFATANVTGRYTAVLIVADTIAAAITAPLSGYIAPNASVIDVYKPAAGGIARLQGADLLAGSTFYLSVTYAVS